MRGLFLALLAAGAMGQSGSFQGRVSGVVAEPGIAGAPVADAEVTLDYYGPQQPRFMPSPPQKSITTTTSATGGFVFPIEQAGFYGVHSKKDGFQESGGSASAPTRLNFTLAEKDPSREVKLFLARPATVTGTVIDAETGKPLANVQLAGGPVMRLEGMQMFLGAPVSTNAEGRFAITGNAGDWAVQVLPQIAQKDRVRQTFSDEDFEKVDTDFEHTFWPGGYGEDAAMPLDVASGAKVDLGRIRVKRTNFYRVRLRVPKSNCAADDVVALYDTTRGPNFLTRTTNLASGLPCGKDLLIVGFAPGSYWIGVATKTAPRAIALVPVTITNKNVEAVASMTRGIAVDGRVVAEDGASLPELKAIRVMLDPFRMVRFADSMKTASPDEKGAFHVENVPEFEHRILVNGVPPSHYVKAVKFNGVTVADNIVPLDRPAMGHTLTIVLDDKPATLSGTVREGDHALGGAPVLLAKWPLAADPFFQAAGRVTTDEQGRFQIAGLAPGEYRAVAVRTAEENRGRAPGSIERAFAAASKIELGARESKTVDLAVVTLR